jgi:hypothetical protein
MQAIARHPELELAGCRMHSQAGRGQLAPAGNRPSGAIPAVYPVLLPAYRRARCAAWPGLY